MSDIWQINQAISAGKSDYGAQSSQAKYDRNMFRTRYARERQGLFDGFRRNMPSQMGAFQNRGFGSQVSGGVFNQALQRIATDFQDRVGTVDSEAASWLANWEAQRAQRRKAYNDMMMTLLNSRDMASASQNPYSNVQVGL